MPSPKWEDLNEFLDLGDFAIVGDLFISGQFARRINGIFDEPSIDAGAGASYQYDTTGPTFLARETDAAGITQADQIHIAGRVYDITRLPEVDGTGMAVLRLAPTLGDGGR